MDRIDRINQNKRLTTLREKNVANKTFVPIVDIIKSQ